MRTSKLLAIGILLAAIPLVAIPAPSPLSDLELIARVMREVQRDYVRPVGTDVLSKDALKGMVSRLDPHSDYLDEQEYREAQADISEKFGCIGIDKAAAGTAPLGRVIFRLTPRPRPRDGTRPTTSDYGEDRLATDMNL
jgi:carboxyl-terminal processing protease